MNAPSDGLADAPELSIAAPAYNEQESIEAVVREWLGVLDRSGLSAEIVICNDGSTDETGAILKRLGRGEPRLRTITNRPNRGYGHALATAIADCRGAAIATIDSDGQFDLNDAVRMLEQLRKGGADAVNGRRAQKQDSLARVLADRALNVIVRLLFGTKLRDTNCALKVAGRECLQTLQLQSSGFPLPTEICLKLEALGHRVEEYTIEHRDRTAGESKLRVWSTGWRMLRYLLFLRRQIRLYRAGILRSL